MDNIRDIRWSLINGDKWEYRYRITIGTEVNNIDFMWSNWIPLNASDDIYEDSVLYEYRKVDSHKDIEMDRRNYIANLKDKEYSDITVAPYALAKVIDALRICGIHKPTVTLEDDELHIRWEIKK